MSWVAVAAGITGLAMQIGSQYTNNPGAKRGLQLGGMGVGLLGGGLGAGLGGAGAGAGAGAAGAGAAGSGLSIAPGMVNSTFAGLQPAGFGAMSAAPTAADSAFSIAPGMVSSMGASTPQNPAMMGFLKDLPLNMNILLGMNQRQSPAVPGSPVNAAPMGAGMTPPQVPPDSLIVRTRLPAISPMEEWLRRMGRG